MEKMDLDQVESGPPKSEKPEENKSQETSSSSKGTSGQNLNAVGDIQEIQDKLNELKNEEGLVTRKKMKFQENEQVEDVAMKNSQDENPLDLSPENLELAQKALAIDLILIKILENLPTKSLFNFRRVNKTWEKEATNIIMKGMKTQLRFFFDSQSKKVVIPCTQRKDLNDLNECIRKSRRFPCSNFRFYEIPLKNAALMEFFTLHGTEVKRLDLKVRRRDVSKLGNFLLNQGHKIPWLDIDSSSMKVERNSNPTSLFPENSVLPRLKYFSYYHFPFASEIIRVSPNLKQVLIEDNSLNRVGSFFETLKSMHKIHLLKKVTIKNNYENILLLELLADGNSKIEKLTLRLNSGGESPSEFLKRRFANALSKILDSSKETLTHVELRLHENFLTGVKWPRLDSVWELTVRSGAKKRIDIPANFLSRVFPNIREFKNLGKAVPSLLIFDTPLTHLKECELHQNEILNLDNLSSFAPNLTILKICYVKDFPGIANSLWACSGLKELKIELMAATNSPLQIDMAFTGLSEEMVKKLHKYPKYFNKMKLNKKEIPRINLSILNCPDLTHLKILVNVVRSSQLPNPVDSLVTSVAREFGFEMIEDLRVEIVKSNGMTSYV